MAHITIDTNVPVNTHKDLTRVVFAIARAFGTRPTTVTVEEMKAVVLDNRPLIDCVGCGDLHYAPLCKA